MAKTSRPRKKMDRYFRNTQKNSYLLDSNKRGSATTKLKKWDSVRRLSKRIVTEDKHGAKVPKDACTKSGVQLLPRKTVPLYGIIPAMEDRVYSKCKNCCCVFNPRDVITHKNCSRSYVANTSMNKKKVPSKNGSSKKPSSNGSTASHSMISNVPIVTAAPCSVQDPLKFFEFTRPFTPPPLKAEPTLPQLKVSVTKIGVSKSSKSTAVTTSTAPATVTTSSDKSESKVSSSKVSSAIHHSSKSSSGHHSSRGHSPKSPSSSSSSSSTSHHRSRSPSTHHSPKSPSSSGHHASKTVTPHHSPRSPSKSSSSSSHHGSSHSGSHHSSKSSSSKPTPMDTLPPGSSSSSHHHHSHRHKKPSSGSSKRSGSSSSSNSASSSTSSSNSSKSLPKNYNPDTHCGVIEGNRGPCMRSITCSNHRLHLRKQVSGRSKDIHQLIAERKAAKENDLKHTTVPCSYASPNGESKDIISSSTTYVPVAAQVVGTNIENSATNTFVHIMPRISTHQTRLSTTTSVLAKKLIAGEASGIESAKTLKNCYITRAKNLENTQDSVIGTVPVVIMPVSPVSVVSSVQLLKIGNNIISLESPQSAANPPLRKQVILPITSSHTNGIRMYKSHPKPIILPNFGARKLGGAIILANPLLEDQRNNLLTTIDLKLETVNIERGLSGLNHSNSPHRPNILKGKGSVKVNCKRPASDKLTTGDSKRLVPDVNGFILETDVSETADALQYSGDNELSQHESIIRLIDQHGF